MSIETAIRKEKNGYVFLCECGRESKSKPYYFSKHSGKCRSCCVKKEPFLHVYNAFLNSAKFENKKVEIEFKDFLDFTKIDSCHYCLTSIPWRPYKYENSRHISCGYFLDRKDNDVGYSKTNIVVCCTKCNLAKGSRYSYDEWYGMTAYFRKKD